MREDFQRVGEGGVMDKQKIARLVAEKVWGWHPFEKNPQEVFVEPYFYTSNGEEFYDPFFHSMPQLKAKVFSWNGFGRTVERMGEWFRTEVHDNKHGDQEFMFIKGIKTDYVRQYGLITACHLAALDALGIDWRE